MSPTVALDPDQRAAVDFRDGACLVLAGPGSGKTRVIVERFLALLEAGVPASRQVVLTYTVRAAAEMRSRAEQVCGPFAGDSPLLNFHSFGRRVLREWGWLVGVAPGFRVADAAERWLALEAVLEEQRPRTLWNPLRPHDLVEALLDLIEKAKQELVTPEAYAAWAQRRLENAGDDEVQLALLGRHAECAAVYAGLQERMRRHALLDHDDCILLADTVLREHAAARSAICGAAEYVMVDEFQDTNLAQARLVETLATTHENLLVVADDDQSIYKFRGASLANLDRFARDHPGHTRITLGHNYRSTRAIVTACRAIIAAAAVASRIPKTVEAAGGQGVDVELWQAHDTRSECLAVATACREWVAATPELRYSDIAWLFRRHEDMRPAMAALQEACVPYRVHGGRGYFQQPEIKDLLALLTVIDEPRDSQALIRCLHLPAWKVSAAGRLALVRVAAADERPLADLLRDAQAVATLLPGERDAVAAKRCADDILELHALAQHADARDVLFEAVARSGFVGGIEPARDVERAQVGANLSKMAELFDAFADWATDIRLRPALRYVAVLRDSGEADKVAPVDVVEDGVVLLTAHGAKGLEWPVVVVGGSIERRWPGRPGFTDRLRLPDELVDEPPPEGDSHLDEERRIFYVAATRAKDRLVFTWATRTPQSYEDERPSPFLGPVAEVAGEARILPFAAPAGQRRRPAAGQPLSRMPAVGVRDLRDFKDCPRRYEYRRRYHMPVRRSVLAWYGTLIHETLERAGRLRVAGGEVGADELVGIWGDKWAAADGGFRGAHPELLGYGEESLRRYAESDAWRAARPVAVEQPFLLAVEDGALSGRFDRVDQPRGALPVVVDYKTGPPRGEDSAQRDLQVRAYAVALARQEGVDEVAVELHHLQTAEVTRIHIDDARLRRAGGQISATVAELARAWAERWFPPNAAPFRCRSCDFRTVCDEGRAAAAAPE